ncbi:cytochrome C oxidase subunit IV family protein [Luteibaculum oceani]|uniref:Cytochrome C oxidase subunit IV n=1 Tax=Luteibaculum oceani TaxID=1294296 RepID=A0A5C6VKA9_9FLAO|nr:cytochrome C oxidase subunit IV family protein [Luteibaculum oceani]TXC85044.1 cytochrome C oxidase subunit IV [Luteibaculum oceani]
MERDDIIEYAPDQVHGEEAGRKIRKNIIKVTLLLTVITAVEVLVGVFYGRGTVSDTTWFWIKLFYIILTLVKAGYIVMSFMHLGDERKNARNVILYPYALFICYLIFIALTESSYVHDMLVKFF